MAVMSKTLYIKMFMALISLMLVSYKYSKSQHCNSENSFETQIILFNFKKGKLKGQQLIKIFWNDSKAVIKLYDDYEIIIVPKEGLSQEQLSLAKLLINTKDISGIPEKYKKYLSIHLNDSLSILKIEERYNVVKTFSMINSFTLNCIEALKIKLAEKSSSQDSKLSENITKIVFTENGATKIYYLDGSYDSKYLFSCLLLGD